MRLPRPRLSWLTGLLARPGVLYALYTLVLFVVFLLVTFPHDVLVRRALEFTENPDVAIDVDGAHFAWTGGYQLEGVRLTALPQREGVPPLLELATLQLRPDFRSLLRGEVRSVVVAGELYGGQAHGVATARNGTMTANLQWADVDIRRYRAFSRWLDEGSLMGKLSGEWTMDLPLNGRGPVGGGGRISLTRASLTGGKAKGFTIPDLQISDATLEASIAGGEIEVKEFQATGPDLSIQASGTITMREPQQNSALNARVTIQKLPESIKPLLALLPRRGGKAGTTPSTLNISGTMARPVVR